MNLLRSLSPSCTLSFRVFAYRKMITNAAISSLPVPLRDLVAAASPRDEDFGLNEKDKTEVSEWIAKVVQGDIVHPSTVKDLDGALTSRTYVVNNYLTAADVALYGALHPTISQLQPAQYYSLPALTRYFDYIQTRPSVRKIADAFAPAFSLVAFDLDNMPKIERKAAALKAKEKVQKAAPDASVPATDEKPQKQAKATSSETAPVEGEVVPKKENKVKSGDAEGIATKKAAGNGAEDAGEPVPSMIDLRVGHIVEIDKHPDADGLYVEKIDIGEGTGPRTVVSGLVRYIPIEEMRDKDVVVVCNLKAANMRGVKSFAMVLCATSKEGKDEGGIELVQPPSGSVPGDRVYFEGEEYENRTPLSQLNPKKKIFETIQPGFTTLESKEAAWINPGTQSIHKIRTEKGVCIAPYFVGASLS